MTRYTAIVVGAGSGGLTMAIGLTGMGRQVLLVEAGDVGGDCTNTGCIPSKTLLSQAGAGTGAVQALAHTRAKRDELRDRETEEMDHMEGLTFVQGRAKLIGAGRVEITRPNGEAVIESGEHVVICTGSKPRQIEIDGLDDARLLTNESLWDLTDAPDHLVIVGGGAIGVEMATAFRALGSKVTIIEAADRLLAPLDEELSAIVADAFADRGIEVRLGVRIERFDAPTGSLILDGGPAVESPAVENTAVENVDKVLVAIGRIPRTEDLGLEAVGVAVDRGITIDDWGRTNVEGVWAIGDVTGRTLTTHGANAFGRRAVQAIGLPRLPRWGDLPSIPGAVYSDPQAAWVGASLDELAGYDQDRLITFRQDLADIDRGYTDGTQFGALIVHAERFTGKIVRAAMVGPGAAEAIGLFTLAIDQEISLHKIFRMVHPYPAYAGAIGQIADDFARQTLPNLRQESLSWLKARPGTLLSRFRS